MKTLIVLISIIIASCASLPKKGGFVKSTETAHKKTAFLAKEAIQFDIHLKFGGKTRIKGKMTMLTDSSKSRIDYEDGRKIIQVNDQVYYSNDFKTTGKIRFDAYTWSYFFLFPYKLSDKGTKWKNYPNKNLNGEKFLVEKLTFANGVGDAPDDWYIVYADMQERLIEAAAYIVTYGKDKETAEQDPHAIKYSNYKDVAGIPIATHWGFWGWTAEKGLKKQLGSANISNIKFIKAKSTSFKPSKNLIHYIK